MKKILLFALGILVSGAVVWAVTVSNVAGVVEKTSGDAVSFPDFNSLIDTTRGIFNTGSSNYTHKIGINKESFGKKSSLIVKDLILIKPGTPKPACNGDIEGSIFAETGNGNHLWGCNGAIWRQLDTNAPVCN